MFRRGACQRIPLHGVLYPLGPASRTVHHGDMIGQDNALSDIRWREENCSAFTQHLVRGVFSWFSMSFLFYQCCPPYSRMGAKTFME